MHPEILYWSVGGVFLFLILVSMFGRILTTVEAGTIRLVTTLNSGAKIYRGPGKAIEVPLLTTGTTIPSKAINIDLDIADQTADIDRNGQPKPIKVRVLASAIVSVGDTDEMITTAANKFFSKPQDEQTSILSDLLTSTGRRAINLLNHDELFSAKVPNSNVDQMELTRGMASTSAEEDDRLAIIIKSACSRELQDLGLVFNSLNIKEVQSEVAEARRRQSAVEAKANADIVAADQERRAREAQLGAEQAINDKQRDLEQRRAQNAATVAEAEAKRQDALADSARIGTESHANRPSHRRRQPRVRIQAEAAADAEAFKIRALGTAQADAIRAVNEAIQRKAATRTLPSANSNSCRRSPRPSPSALAQAKTDQHQQRHQRRRARRGGRRDRPDHRRHSDPSRHPARRYSDARRTGHVERKRLERRTRRQWQRLGETRSGVRPQHHAGTRDSSGCGGATEIIGDVGSATLSRCPKFAFAVIQWTYCVDSKTNHANTNKSIQGLDQRGRSRCQQLGSANRQHISVLRHAGHARSRFCHRRLRGRRPGVSRCDGPQSIPHRLPPGEDRLAPMVHRQSRPRCWHVPTHWRDLLVLLLRYAVQTRSLLRFRQSVRKPRNAGIYSDCLLSAIRYLVWVTGSTGFRG